jgi:hypothetical protein
MIRPITRLDGTGPRQASTQAQMQPSSASAVSPSLLSLLLELLPNVQAELYPKERVYRAQVYALRLQAICKALYNRLRLSQVYVRVEKPTAAESYLLWADRRGSDLKRIKIRFPSERHRGPAQCVDNAGILWDIAKRCPSSLDYLSICSAVGEELDLRSFRHCAITGLCLDVMHDLSPEYVQPLLETFPCLRILGQPADICARQLLLPVQPRALELHAAGRILATAGSSIHHHLQQLSRTPFAASSVPRGTSQRDNAGSGRMAGRRRPHSGQRRRTPTWTDIPLVRHISGLWTAIADIAVRFQDLSTHSCAVIEVDMSSSDDFTLELADTTPTKTLYTTCATSKAGASRCPCDMALVGVLRRKCAPFSRSVAAASWPMRPPTAATIREHGNTGLGFAAGPSTDVLVDGTRFGLKPDISRVWFSMHPANTRSTGRRR